MCDMSYRGRSRGQTAQVHALTLCGYDIQDRRGRGAQLRVNSEFPFSLLRSSRSAAGQGNVYVGGCGVMKRRLTGR